jgi:hypothetical protein
MDDRLLIPVTALPSPVPKGAPIAEYWGCIEHGPQSLDRWRWSHCRHEDHDTEAVECSTYDALDLSPPPLDPAGFPLRIDGLDVAAGMLARVYCGVPVGPASFVIYDARLQTWQLSALYWSGRLFASDARYYGAYHDQYPVPAIPALADIDPTDPLAPRLAMVAIMRAGPWSSR